MNEPQLSAEMEKRLKKLFYKEYLVKSDPEDYIHEGLDSSQQYSHLKAFLATALEEQRAKVREYTIKEILDLPQYTFQPVGGFSTMRHINVSDIENKLNQLKEEE